MTENLGTIPFVMQHGFTYDYVLPVISGNEWKIFCVIYRNTLGWQDENGDRIKTVDLSYDELKTKSGVKSSATLTKAVKSLDNRKLIIVTSGGFSGGKDYTKNRYGINLKYNKEMAQEGRRISRLGYAPKKKTGGKKPDSTSFNETDSTSFNETDSTSFNEKKYLKKPSINKSYYNKAKNNDDDSQKQTSPFKGQPLYIITDTDSEYLGLHCHPLAGYRQKPAWNNTYFEMEIETPNRDIVRWLRIEDFQEAGPSLKGQTAHILNDPNFPHDGTITFQSPVHDEFHIKCSDGLNDDRHVFKRDEFEIITTDHLVCERVTITKGYGSGSNGNIVGRLGDLYMIATDGGESFNKAIDQFEIIDQPPTVADSLEGQRVMHKKEGFPGVISYEEDTGYWIIFDKVPGKPRIPDIRLKRAEFEIIDQTPTPTDPLGPVPVIVAASPLNTPPVLKTDEIRGQYKIEPQPQPAPTTATENDGESAGENLASEVNKREHPSITKTKSAIAHYEKESGEKMPTEQPRNDSDNWLLIFKEFLKYADWNLDLCKQGITNAILYCRAPDNPCKFINLQSITKAAYRVAIDTIKAPAATSGKSKYKTKAQKARSETIAPGQAEVWADLF